MRRSPLVVLCALMLLAALPVLAASGDAAAEGPDAELSSLSLEEIMTPNVDVEDPLDLPALDSQPATLCPYGGPVCVEHDDCDEFCGDPAFGYCEILGHFPDGCCSCLG